jgi:hypothetical protein
VAGGKRRIETRQCVSEHGELLLKFQQREVKCQQKMISGICVSDLEIRVFQKGLTNERRMHVQ